NTVVELALGQSPDDRYPSCSDFATDLERTFQEGFDGTSGRRPLITPIGWVLALALVVFIRIIAFALRHDPEQDAENADAAIREKVYNEPQQSQPSPEQFKSVYEKNPSNMIYIPPGPYVEGRLRNDPAAGSSEPLAEQKVTKDYLIDVFEYPNLKG